MHIFFFVSYKVVTVEEVELYVREFWFRMPNDIIVCIRMDVF